MINFFIFCSIFKQNCDKTNFFKFIFLKKRGFFKDMSYEIDRYIKLIFTNNEKKINIYMLI